MNPRRIVPLRSSALAAAMSCGRCRPTVPLTAVYNRKLPVVYTSSNTDRPRILPVGRIRSYRSIRRNSLCYCNCGTAVALCTRKYFRVLSRAAAPPLATTYLCYYLLAKYSNTCCEYLLRVHVCTTTVATVVDRAGQTQAHQTLFMHELSTALLEFADLIYVALVSFMSATCISTRSEVLCRV